jgi:hypothetical protein
MEVCLSRKPTIRRRLFPLQLASDIPVMTCCVNTVQKVDVAQRVEELLSCIQIYGCATRGTKFLHIRKEVTTVAYLMAAQNCLGSEYRCPENLYSGKADKDQTVRSCADDAVSYARGSHAIIVSHLASFRPGGRIPLHPNRMPKTHLPKFSAAAQRRGAYHETPTYTMRPSTSP